MNNCETCLHRDLGPEETPCDLCQEYNEGAGKTTFHAYAPLHLVQDGDEERIDVIGQNGNTGEHYAAATLQVGGTHYACMAIQPFTYIHANGLGFAEGCVVKYVSRWRNKNGVEDLKKARHFLDLLIEAEEKRNG